MVGPCPGDRLGGSDVEEVPGRLREPVVRNLADVLALIQLLGVLAGGEETVAGATGTGRAIERSSVPQVAVEHGHGTGRSDDQPLVGMPGIQVVDVVARRS